MSHIRKISVGSDIDKSVKYTVGYSVIDGNHTVREIKVKGDYISIWVKNRKGETLKWKDISVSSPHVIEYNLNF